MSADAEGATRLAPPPAGGPADGSGSRDAADLGGRLATLLLPLVGIGSLLALWEIAPRAGWVRPTSVPPFSQVLPEIGVVLRDPRFWVDVQASAGRWAVGFALAIAIGVPLGIAMGRSRAFFYALDPLLTVSYPVPKAALILILVLWFEAGNLSRILIIILGCLIPIVMSAYHGANGVEPRLLWSARALGTGRAATLFKVVLPAALPQILSGLRLAIAISIFALLASELLIRQSGIGSYLFTFYDLGATLRVWATASIIAVGGFCIDALYVRGVRAGLRWLEGEV